MEQDQDRHIPPETPSLVDRIGPKTLAGVLIALITATAVGAVALRDLVTTSTVDIAYLKGRADDHEKRLREQEHRPPRLHPALDDLRERCDEIGDIVTLCRERAAVMERDIQHIQKEQDRDRLCARVSQCRER